MGNRAVIELAASKGYRIAGMDTGTLFALAPDGRRVVLVEGERTPGVVVVNVVDEATSQVLEQLRSAKSVVRG